MLLFCETMLSLPFVLMFSLQGLLYLPLSPASVSELSDSSTARVHLLFYPGETGSVLSWVWELVQSLSASLQSTLGLRKSTFGIKTHFN